MSHPPERLASPGKRRGGSAKKRAALAVSAAHPLADGRLIPRQGLLVEDLSALVLGDDQMVRRAFFVSAQLFSNIRCFPNGRAVVRQFNPFLIPRPRAPLALTTHPACGFPIRARVDSLSHIGPRSALWTPAKLEKSGRSSFGTG